MSHRRAAPANYIGYYSNLFLISKSRSTLTTLRNDGPAAPMLTGRSARGSPAASHHAALPCSRLPAVTGSAKLCRALARFARDDAARRWRSRCSRVASFPARSFRGLPPVGLAPLDLTLPVRFAALPCSRLPPVAVRSFGGAPFGRTARLAPGEPRSLRSRGCSPSNVRPSAFVAYLLREENRIVTKPLPGNSTGPDASITSIIPGPE